MLIMLSGEVMLIELSGWVMLWTYVVELGWWAKLMKLS